MGRIIQLDQSVINQIAAGEIIERPASVVKELVENSIDAGATEITVEIEGGGRDLIRIVDNGEGITRQDLPVALLPHATSKLTSSEQLAEVLTLGFRGEAIASIASVSKLSIKSRTPGELSGYMITSEYGEHSEVETVGMREGTIIEIEGLFKRLPAREKFLKGPGTESAHVSEMVQRFALSYPMIGFRLKSGNRNSLFAPPAPNQLERIRKLLGDDIANSLQEVEYEYPRVGRVFGFVSLPPMARGNSKMQYTFLNGRHIKDRQIQSAISESYRGRLISGQYPLVFLSYVISPSLFDVNVHPTKVEVRFIDKNKMFSLTYSAVSAALNSSSDPLPVAPTLPSEPRSFVQEATKRSILDFYTKPSSGRSSGSKSSMPPSSLPLKMWSPPGEGIHREPYLPTKPLYRQEEEPESFGDWKFMGSLSNTYLFFSTPKELIVVDQHALHERILYEELLLRAGEVESQRLLIPQTVELSASEFEYWEKAAEQLAKAGFEIEKFGEKTVAIHAVPSNFPIQKCGEAFQRAVSEVAGETSKDEGRALLEMMACKAAIKAGDSLTWIEISTLLARYRELEERGNTCPHGRPAVIRIHQESVKKWFKRT